ncbi:MAG: RidA family protein, partial [Betaproteobacteria bacterium]|nr:RidA family protein [Betaproteobacteria bacterium]
MQKTVIHAETAPAAVGAYSHAVRVGGLVFISGQIPLAPDTGEIVAGDAAAQIAQAFANLAAVCKAAGGGLDDIAKLTVYLTDLGDFAAVNAAMEKLFSRPFPARAALGVAALPKGARVEV